MLTALRREARAAFETVRTARPPFLRRSLEPDWLLCTDLPLLAAPEALRDVRSRLEAAGWRTALQGDRLLQLDRLPPPPDPPWPDPLPATEAGCCLELLRRHPEGRACGRELRALLKAQEAGGLEACCAAWHRAWAAALRRHERLPAALLPYLILAAQTERPS